MSKVVRIQHAQGTFLAEVDERVQVAVVLTEQPSRPTAPDGMQPVVSLDDLTRSFSDISDLIVTCCTGLFEAIERIPKPKKVAVDFGIKLGGETGVPLLTKASGEASFHVTVEWAP